MGWGYYLDARLTLSRSAWRAIARQRTDAFPTQVGWWGMRDAALERRFVDAFGDASKGMTLDKLVRFFAFDESIGRIETQGSDVSIRIVTMLAKDMDTDIARGVSALFEAAATVGGDGAVSLVNDGTYVGEDGVTVRLRGGKLTRKAISGGAAAGESIAAMLYGDLDASEEAARPAPRHAKLPSGFTPPSLRHLLTGGLDVEWQCAATKQVLLVEIDHGVRVPATYPIHAMRNVEGFACAGMLGGDRFAPSVGMARARGGPKVVGTTVSWTVETAGICPEALPLIVEQLAVGGRVPGSEARALRVRGSLRPARGAESLYVDTRRAVESLRAATAPRAWDEPTAFGWQRVRSRGRSARLTVEIERPTKKASGLIDSALANLGFFAVLGPNAAGNAVSDAGVTEIDGTGNVRAGTWKPFDTSHEAFAAAARNALVRADQEGARVVRAELALP